MVLNMNRHKQRGKRVKYSVHGRMITEKGMFFTHDHAWDLTQAVSGVLKKLERKVLRSVEKKRLRMRR
jgi:ribosome-associated translation inhibitor RaiA